MMQLSAIEKQEDKKHLSDVAGATGSRDLLKKHTGAIHVFSELSFLQRKMMNVLLYNAFDDLLSERVHSVSVETLCMLTGFDSKNTNYLKESLLGLSSQLIQWNVLDSKGSEVWGASTLLASVEISDGIISYEYSSKLSEKLYNPKSYARINLAIQRKMTSGTAYALYELGFRYLKVGQTPWLPLDVFKKLIGVEGSKNYEAFFQLNAKVIKPNTKIVNETTDIIIEPVFAKEGRKVAEIKLKVRPNPQLTMVGMEEEDSINQTEAYKRCLKRGIPKLLARQWIVEHGEEYVLEKLDHTDKMEGSGRIKTTASGFLTKAIEQDYKTEEAHNKELRKKADERREKEESISREIDRLNSTLRKVEKAYRNHNTSLITSHVATLSKAKQDEAFQSFRDTLEGNTIALDRFRKDEWESIISHSTIVEFWKDRASLPFPDFSEFAKNHGIADLKAHNSRISELEKI